MRDLIDQLHHHQDLDSSQVIQAVNALLDPDGPETMKADFLHALRVKGETALEIAAFVNAFLARAVEPGLDPKDFPGPLLDVCGTGGDRLELFNISTTAMFLLAAGGATIVKHGNRAITSRSGGADVLEELRIAIEQPPEMLRACVAATGIGFIFAPAYHPSFRIIAPVRRALAAQGITTIFNLLGPLLNPAQPACQLVGVFSESLLPKYAEVLRLLGRHSAWAVHGSSGATGGGTDELSTLGLNHYCAVFNGVISSHTLDPHLLGFPPAEIEQLRGGDCAENARTLHGILDNRIHGPRRDIVILNAAAGFVVSGIAPSMPEAIAHAEAQLDSGAALAKLKALQAFFAYSSIT